MRNLFINGFQVLTVLLIDKTKFPIPDHALKKSVTVAVKGLNNARFQVFKQYAH